jgi:hypothetical protein
MPIVQQDGIKPYSIWFSADPFHKRLDIDIELIGQHPTLGLITVSNPMHSSRLQLQDMEKGTPGHKISKLCSTLRRSIILSFNNQPITSQADLESYIKRARDNNETKARMQFATVQYQPLHPTEGSLMLYYDQMNVVAKHLQAAYTPHKALPQQTTSDGQPTDEGRVCTAISPANTDASADNPDLGKSYTLRELKQRADWDEWRQARYTMLNSYQEQGMFSEPMATPAEANIHHMLWRCVYKLCGTRKARMVCDGSARQGTITLGHTFANSLDTTSERLFWAVVAHKNLVAYGADVSNAFAEAPPPAHPSYLRIDDAFRDWWENHLHRPPIPKHHTVVKVNNAIQGHPESPRLWEKLIDQIWNTIGFKPTTHEPCLYYGIIKGNYTLFLRQVDDFAIATSTKQQATEIIQEIN